MCTLQTPVGTVEKNEKGNVVHIRCNYQIDIGEPDPIERHESPTLAMETERDIAERKRIESAREWATIMAGTVLGCDEKEII